MGSGGRVGSYCTLFIHTRSIKLRPIFYKHTRTYTHTHTRRHHSAPISAPAFSHAHTHRDHLFHLLSTHVLRRDADGDHRRQEVHGRGHTGHVLVVALHEQRHR